MRSRNIKPDLWKDPELAELPLEARYLFPGLWCMADCEGRLEDVPKRIKAEIYPYDESISAGRVHELLQLLADGGFIIRYLSGIRSYIQIRNFLRHQNPHKNERDKGSQIPEPAADDLVPKKSVQVPNKSEPIPINSVQDPSQDGTARADSLFLIPDSGFPQTDTLNRVSVQIAKPKTKPPTMSGRFQEFWARYPGKKLGQDRSAGMWAHFVTVENEDQVFACLDRYVASAEVARGAIMNPERWLSAANADNWQSDWPRAQTRDSPKLGFADGVTQLIQERIERGEKPW